MGIPKKGEDRRPMAWQGTLAEMKRHGTRVAERCLRPSCGRWTPHDQLDHLIDTYGEDFMLWDRKMVCRVCGGETMFHAAPGPGTPFRPLMGGVEAEARHKAFLRGFGFSRRDIARIKAMAETCDGRSAPLALNDLDVPYRVGACMPGEESRGSGSYLGQWQGRSLLFWGPMTGRELEEWRRRRATGPKPVPSRR
jgi:hypothetical protein